MNPIRRRLPSHVTLTEEEATQLQDSHAQGHTIEVHPPRDSAVIPATVPAFIRSIKELQTTWLGLRNTSPTIAYEIRRTLPGTIRFQYTVPTKRVERKVRLHLSEAIDGVGFSDGSDGLPVTAGTTLGGGLLTTGRRDWHPLQTEFDTPPANSLVAALHRHAMQDTQIVVQILFQPVVGRPVRNWWWRTQAHRQKRFLRNDKEQLWGRRSPSKRERKQADAIEHKAGNPRFHTSIRLLITGAGDYTPSRIKELAGSFNRLEHPLTGQYLDLLTVRSLRHGAFVRFARAIADRQFGGWSRTFQASIPELAALVSLPDRNQSNIQSAQP